MTTSTNSPDRDRDRQRARGQIEIAIQRLAGKYPFHAKILEQFVLRCSLDIDTMAVTIAQDRVLLLYSPEFVLAISVDELGGVLLHEVHHVLFRHLLADLTRYPDRWARLVAEEVTVNEFVHEPLPGKPLRLTSFPDLPPMESTEQRYQRLKVVTERPPVIPLRDFLEGGMDEDARADMPGLSSEPLGTIIDDHSVWEHGGDPELAESILQEVVQDAAIEVGIDQIPEELRASLLRLGIGRQPGSGEYEFDGFEWGQLDWIRLLRRYTGRHLKPEPDFTRPSRRFPNLVGVVPGRRRRGGRPQVMAVIDTSASITPDLLDLINSELARMAADHEVTVVECDTEIQRVAPFRRMQSVLGRGGTDLRPPFEPDFLRRHRPDLLIYFTDGYGPAPEDPPRVPVIWCLTENGIVAAEWGRSLRMTNNRTI